LDLARLLAAAAQSGSVFAFSRHVLFDLVVTVLAVSYRSTRFDTVYGCYFLFISAAIFSSARSRVCVDSTSGNHLPTLDHSD
jgi:hypothetical protein